MHTTSELFRYYTHAAPGLHKITTKHIGPFPGEKKHGWVWVGWGACGFESFDGMDGDRAGYV